MIPRRTGPKGRAQCWADVLRSARAGDEAVANNDCEMADEQSRGGEQLRNNNKVHDQILYMFQARAVYVLRLTPR